MNLSLSFLIFWNLARRLLIHVSVRYSIYLGLATVLLAGCATHHRALPRYETPLAKTEFQTVRTTAYTHTEADHLAYGKHNALGTTLCCGAIKSAAADWSRWPAGTIFRIVQTGETYQVDDYGWALAGRNTIDLYKPTRFDMDQWGVRAVTIQVLQWGDMNYSYHILRQRNHYPHVRRMVLEIEGKPV